MQSIFIVMLSWIGKLIQEYQNDPIVQKVLQEIHIEGATKFELKGNLILQKANILVPTTSTIKTKILNKAHSSLIIGHIAIDKTYRQFQHTFFWGGMNVNIHKFVSKCDIYQRKKSESMKNPRLLQPLHIPE